MYYSLVSEAVVPARSSGWQVFHIDSIASWRPGNNRLELQIYVMDQDDRTLKCPDFSSLFVLPYTQSYGSGELINGGLDDDYLRSFFPVVTTFVTAIPLHIPLPMYKRSTETKGIHKPNELENICEPQDHHVSLAEFFPGLDIVSPKVANIKRCNIDCASDSESQETDTQCIPTNYNDLDVLVRKKDSEHIIQTLPDMIVQECHCA